MGANSKIEWTHHTFNPWWGCVKVSPGCEHCYAETFSKRTGHHIWGPAATTQRRLFGNKHWAEPLKWNREAEAAGERHRVFCASMADVFEDHPQLISERVRLWRLIEDTPHLDWLLLTKRPENTTRMMPTYLHGYPRNIWLGTSVENQQQADKRIPELLKVPAAVRFLSCEPLLGLVDISGRSLDSVWINDINDPLINEECNLIDWVIVGGESGPKARPMHPNWARSLRDQCTAAGVAFHFKQWGEWLPFGMKQPTWDFEASEYFQNLENRHVTKFEFHDPSRRTMYRVGKKAAGRLLDGREWNEYPIKESA